DGVQLLGTMTGDNEAIDRQGGPAARVNGRRDWPEWLEGPMRLTLDGVTRGGPRPRRARGDPGGQGVLGPAGGRLVRGHLERIVGTANCPNQRAALQVARHDSRAAVATGEHRLT